MHFQLINKFARDLTDAHLSAAVKAIPHTCRQQDSGGMAGKSEYEQHLREKSLIWHKMREDCGCSRAGTGANSMRHNRAQWRFYIGAGGGGGGLSPPNPEKLRG